MTVSEMRAMLEQMESEGRGDQEVRVALFTDEQGAMDEGRMVSVEVDQSEQSEVVYVVASERRETYISRGVKEEGEWSQPEWMA